MTFSVHINEKPSKEQQTKVHQPQTYTIIGRSQSKECLSIKICAIIFAWVTAIVPTVFFVTLILDIADMFKFCILHGHFNSFQAVITLTYSPIVIGIFLLFVANIHGVHKDKPSYMRPWLICNLVCVPYSICLKMDSLEYKGFAIPNDIIFFFGIAVYTTAFVIEYFHFRNITKPPTTAEYNYISHI